MHSLLSLLTVAFGLALSAAAAAHAPHLPRASSATCACPSSNNCGTLSISTLVSATSYECFYVGTPQQGDSPCYYDPGTGMQNGGDGCCTGMISCTASRKRKARMVVERTAELTPKRGSSDDLEDEMQPW